MSLPKRPLQSTSVASRCRCGDCAEIPELTLSGGKDGGPVTITAKCCGKEETRTLTKEQLLVTQWFFTEQDNGRVGEVESRR